MITDILIVGAGCSGLYCALKLPADKKITILSKGPIEESDSFLAQGGMCMLKDPSDYDSYLEDTMKAGHYENDKESVDIMIRSSVAVVEDLLSYGADFAKEADGSLAYTREGAHSEKRIIFHEDVTGKEITSSILRQVQKLPNVTIMENVTLLDLVTEDNTCFGGVVRLADNTITTIAADYTILATGGVGGLYRHSTNFRHLTGDALAMALNHGIELKDVHYVQIHPTTLYSEKEEDRSFLISESVRGEGALLYDKAGNRFVNELLPRDLLTIEIRKQMEKDGTPFVWEDLRPIPEEELKSHFPNIVQKCLNAGYDVTKECIPVVPAQHYFMGGIKVNHESKTSMEHLYAIGETACNGVHGRNRLASNSLLESLVFASRAAKDLIDNETLLDNKQDKTNKVDLTPYQDKKQLTKKYKELVLNEIKRSQALDSEYNN